MNDTLFWASVDRSAGPDGCWIWLGPRNGEGDGRVRAVVGGRWSMQPPQRIAWFLKHDSLPPLTLRYTCQNRICCNPAHAAVVARAKDDKVVGTLFPAQALAQQGENNSSGVLTEEAARNVLRRLAAGETGRSLALEYGVTAAAISMLKHGRTWRHLLRPGGE